MKKSYTLFALLLSSVCFQACGPKSSKNEHETSMADSIANQKKLDSTRAESEKAAKEQARLERKKAADARKSAETYDVSGTTVYNRSEVKPQFKGGTDAMNKYFKDNLKYPEAASDNPWEGMVYVDFVVGADGKVQYAEVTEDTDAAASQAFRDEALRVIMNMPVWVPGKQHGKSVPVSYNLPISFQAR